MKHLTKVLLILLVFAMLCPLAISCTDSSDDEKDTPTNQKDDNNTTPNSTTTAGGVVDGTTTAGGVVDGTTAPVYTGVADQQDDLDQYKLNFNNDKVNILNWAAEKPEFYMEKTDGTKVNDAIWERNNAIETRLSVELVFTEIPGNNSNKASFISAVEAASGQKLYDIIATYSRTASSCSLRGLYIDLNTIEGSYINLDQTWWPETLIDTVTIDDSLYFISGDASTNVLHFMYTIYFNKDLKAKYTDIEEDLYQLVRDGNWTVTRLITLASNRYEDLNNNGKGAAYSSTDLEDAYGFCTIYYGVDAFYSGAGLKLVTQDPDTILKVSEDYSSQKALELSEKLGAFLSGPDCSTFMGNGQYRQPFVNGNALFCQERAYLASNYLGDVGFKYGILPTPKYNAKQENYITIIGNPFTLYAISSDCDSLEQMTAVLECWGSEAYRKTTPALFYETMQARYADAPDDYDMWEIIRTTACFDLGRLYGSDDMGFYISEEWSKIACQNVNWQRKLVTILDSLQSNLAGIVKKYQDLK